MATKTIRRRNRIARPHPLAGEKASAQTKDKKARTEIPGIIDHKVTLLAVAGAAVSADCDPCLDMIVPELEGTGITRADIRNAVESGRFLGAYPDLGARVFERDCDDAHEDHGGARMTGPRGDEKAGGAESRLSAKRKGEKR